MKLDERVKEMAGAMEPVGSSMEHQRWCNDENAYMEAQLYMARGMVLLQQ